MVVQLAAAVTVIKRDKIFGKFITIADVTFDTSYPTGGEALTPNQFGLNVIDFMLPSPTAGYIFQFDHANKKLKAFTPTKAQVAHTHAENAAEAYTKDAVTGTGGAIAAAAAAEVANTTDLHTLVVRVLAIGY